MAGTPESRRFGRPRLRTWQFLPTQTLASSADPDQNARLPRRSQRRQRLTMPRSRGYGRPSARTSTLALALHTECDTCQEGQPEFARLLMRPLGPEGPPLRPDGGLADDGRDAPVWHLHLDTRARSDELTVDVRERNRSALRRMRRGGHCTDIAVFGEDSRAARGHFLRLLGLSTSHRFRESDTLDANSAR